MNDQKEYLKDLTEIRSIMERSSRFISLSGLSGISVGIVAIISSYIFYYFQSNNLELILNSNKQVFENGFPNNYIIIIKFLLLIGLSTLFIAIAIAIFFTTRNAKKQGVSIWSKTAKNLVINMSIPLFTGGLFCFLLLINHELYLIIPSTLIFYGLSLINSSKFTINDIRYLGFCEIALGIISMISISYSFVIWIIGFGILHIVYGTIMYLKYERKQ